MALKKFRPTSPGTRFKTALTFDEITKARPEKSLTEAIKKTGGRDNRGRITVRFIGGGHKQRYRTVDFRRNKGGVPAKVPPTGWRWGPASSPARVRTSFPGTRCP